MCFKSCSKWSQKYVYNCSTVSYFIVDLQRRTRSFERTLAHTHISVWPLVTTFLHFCFLQQILSYLIFASLNYIIGSRKVKRDIILFHFTFLVSPFNFSTHKHHLSKKTLVYCPELHCVRSHHTEIICSLNDDGSNILTIYIAVSRQ